MNDASPDPDDPLLPATPGTLEPEIARDVRLLRQFTLERERVMSRLFARKNRMSPVRDELIRLIVLAFAEGHSFRTAYYREACAHYVTGAVVRREIAFLESCGLVLLQPDPRHRRATIVVPTRKLIQFYNESMPRLRTEVMSLLGLDLPPA